MPFPPFAPSVFFEDEEIGDLVAEFSERVRRDMRLRPAMDRLVGNQWRAAEMGMEQFLRATMFLTAPVVVDADWLARAVNQLSAADVDMLTDLALECMLATFPLHSAAVIAEVTERLADVIKTVIATDGMVRQKRLLDALRRLNNGALMSGI